MSSQGDADHLRRMVTKRNKLIGSYFKQLNYKRRKTRKIKEIRTKMNS